VGLVVGVGRGIRYVRSQGSSEVTDSPNHEILPDNVSKCAICFSWWEGSLKEGNTLAEGGGIKVDGARRAAGGCRKQKLWVRILGDIDSEKRNEMRLTVYKGVLQAEPLVIKERELSRTKVRSSCPRRKSGGIDIPPGAGGSVHWNRHP
jgi:hypothetical protein